MRRLWLGILLAAIMPLIVNGAIQLESSQEFNATSNVPDTTANVVYVEADSVQVSVYFEDGTEALDTTWYNAGDAQASSTNGILSFFDTWSDMNGSKGVGLYTVHLQWWNGTGSGFGREETRYVQQVAMAPATRADSLQAVLDSVRAIMARLIDVQDTTNGTIDSIQSQDDWVAQEETVKAIALTGTNISTIAQGRTLTDGTETNTYTATQVHDGTYYEVAEGGTGTNLNINYYLEFDIGPNTKAAEVIYHGRLDEGSPPSGNDTIHVWVYDWVGTSWTHINAPGGDFVGISSSTPADDETLTANLVDIDYVGTGANVGLVRISFSNYDPDGAASSNLEETTELYLDYVFLEYQSLLTAQAIWEHDSAQMVLDTTQATKDILDGTLDVNMVQISGDATAADNLETMLDGTGGQALSLGQLLVVASGNDDAVVFTGSGSGEAMKIIGGATGSGIELKSGGGTGTYALLVNGGYGGFYIDPDSGSAMHLQAGNLLGADGLYARSTNTSGFGATFISTAVGQAGLLVSGGANTPDIGGTVIIEDTLTDGEEVAFMPDDWSAADSNAYQGAAGTLDSTAVAGAAQQALEDVGYNSTDSTLDLSTLKVGVARNAGVTGAVQIANGTGPAMYLRSDFAGTEGAALWLRGRAGAHALYMSTDSVGASGSEVSGPTVFITAPDTADAVHIVNISTDSTGGSAMDIRAEGGTATIQIVAGTSYDSATWAAKPNYAIGIEGESYIHGREDRDEGAIRLLGVGTSNTVTIQATTGKTIRHTKNDGSPSGADTIGLVSGGTMIFQYPVVHQGDTVTTMEDLETDHGAGSWTTGGAGSGSETITYVAVDTSGTDEAVENVQITVTNPAGSADWAALSNPSGETVFSLDVDSGYTIQGNVPGYIFPIFTDSITGDKTDTLFGYNRVIGSPGGANRCRVYGYLSDLGANYIQRAKVTATLDENKVRDTCAGTWVFDRSEAANPTGSDGYFYIDLTYSSCIEGKIYTLTVSKTGESDESVEITVPDEATYEVTW